ncbi:Fic family protein [Fulvivirga sp. M361]|uniref:Fic family protein n=1 Tax=Fulvivirga sp. M361 TaxID=2594266 RepID=UPI00117A9935|nr:Fic family protein [Fulvivirga sp. M361]TRX60021.1 Fic family protein [Fulvivirga sp. M361]
MSTLSKLYKEYRSLKLSDIQNYDRYNELLLIHSSSVMEGSTLTIDETEMLIEEDTTPKGKPLEHSLMIKDHFQALQYVIEQSKEINAISESIIKKIRVLIMRSTGGEYSAALGTVDSRLGDFRLSASRAAGGSYYVSHDKIVPMMNDLYKNVNDSINKTLSIDDVMTLSSYAHLQFLTIHPFVDGNGRSARLLQNLILLKHNLPLLIIRHENKADYIAAIKLSRQEEEVIHFETFLKNEYIFHIQNEVNKAKTMKQDGSKGISFTINL